MKVAADPEPFVRSLIACLAGPLVWSAHFFAMYAAATLACAGPMRDEMFLIVAGLVTAAAIAVLMVVLRRQWMDTRRRKGRDGSLFLGRLALALNGLSLLALLWTALPALVIDPCAAPA